MKKKHIYIITMLVSYIMGVLLEQYKQGKKRFLLEDRVNKNTLTIKIYDSWIQQKQNNKSISTFFEKNNFYKIAIYGMNNLGERVVNELQGTNIVVKYAIDRNADKINTNIHVVHPNDILKEVDTVVVTPVYYFNDIEKQLMSKVNCPIISLQDVIDNA